MSDDELKAFAAGINNAAAIAISAQYIARELMVDLAVLQPNPRAWLDGLYERVSHRLDPPEAATMENQARGWARDFVGACFRDALAALEKPSGSS